MLSSQCIVSSSETVRPCNLWGGGRIGHWKKTWRHSQVAEAAMLHLCKQERKLLFLLLLVLFHVVSYVVSSCHVVLFMLFRMLFSSSCCFVGTETSETGAVAVDPLSALHFCYCSQMNWWVVLHQVQIGVSIWDACIPTRLTGERWVEQISRLHGAAC